MSPLLFGLLLQLRAPDEVVEQVRALLRAEALNIILGVVIAVIGLAALTLAAVYWRAGGPLLTFGLLSALYGIRLLARMQSIELLFDLPAAARDYTQSVVTDVIVVPAVAFFYQTVNETWRGSLRWQVWFLAAYAALAVSSDLAYRSPGRMPDPANFLPVLLAITLIHGLAFRRLTLKILDRPETGALAIGSGIFMLSVANEHLVAARLVPWQWRPEPLGFLAFACSLGYIAARRFFAGQQQLLAIEREMAAARQIQSSLLPREVPAVPGLRIAVRYVPMAAVAGDFYDFLRVDDRRLGVLVADTVGHGVPAALVASMIKVAFASQAAHGCDPATLLAEMNQIFCRQAEGQFVTAGYLFLDLEKQTALYAGAGHPPLLLWRKETSSVQEVEENGMPLGFQATATYSSAQLQFRPGDRILMYTDGITEASNRTDELFGTERLKNLLATQSQLAPDDFADRLLRGLATWSGTYAGRNQEDDVTLLVIDIES